jgi:hypothetical protein
MFYLSVCVLCVTLQSLLLIASVKRRCYRGGGGHVFFAKYTLNLACIYPIFSSQKILFSYIRYLFNYTKFFGINALFIFFSMTLSKDTCNKLGLSKSPES